MKKAAEKEDWLGAVPKIEELLCNAYYLGLREQLRGTYREDAQPSIVAATLVAQVALLQLAFLQALADDEARADVGRH